MTRKAVLGAEKPTNRDPRKLNINPETYERILGFIRWAGMAFFVLGAIDIGLTWLPLDFGNREWEFATVTASYNGMPVILLGLMLVAVAATIEMKKGWALGVGVLALMFLVFVLGATVIWATNVPLAMSSVEGVVMTGLKKALFKTAAQSVILPLIFGFIAYTGFKTFRDSRL